MAISSISSASTYQESQARRAADIATAKASRLEALASNAQQDAVKAQEYADRAQLNSDQAEYSANIAVQKVYSLASTRNLNLLSSSMSTMQTSSFLSNSSTVVGKYINTKV